MTAPLQLIACSLDGDGQHARLADWADLLAQASTREETAHGVRYSFASVTSEAESRIRALASAEQGCCSFLQFKIARADDQIEMTVTAPPERRQTSIDPERLRRYDQRPRLLVARPERTETTGSAPLPAPVCELGRKPELGRRGLRPRLDRQLLRRSELGQPPAPAGSTGTPPRS
jgi:hypothetical protein